MPNTEPRYRFMQRDIDEELVWALHCQNASLEHVRKLVAAGADVNVRDADRIESEGNTVLMHAVMDRRVPREIVRYLVDEGADVKAVNHRGESALIRALWNRNLEPATVELLLARGVDIDLRDNDGTTPLLYAVAHPSPRKIGPIIRVLVEAGADVNAADSLGTTVVMHALTNVPKIPLVTVEYLVSCGAVIDYFDEDLLAAAVMGCQPEAIAYLVENGAKLSEIIDEWGTPLDFVEFFSRLQFDHKPVDKADEEFDQHEVERLSGIFKVLVQAGAKRARELV